MNFTTTNNGNGTLTITLTDTYNADALMDIGNKEATTAAYKSAYEHIAPYWALNVDSVEQPFIGQMEVALTGNIADVEEMLNEAINNHDNSLYDLFVVTSGGYADLMWALSVFGEAGYEELLSQNVETINKYISEYIPAACRVIGLSNHDRKHHQDAEQLSVRSCHRSQDVAHQLV